MIETLGVLRVVAAEGKEDPATMAIEEPRVFPIAQEITTLGRGLHNAIVLFDPSVSREHARLTSLHGQWRLTNLSRGSLARVGDHELPAGATVALRPGDRIQLGSTTLQLVAPDLPPSVMRLARTMPPSPGSTLLRSGTNTWLALRQQAHGWGRLGLVGLVLLFLLGLVLVLVGITTIVIEGTPGTGGTSLFAKLTIPLIPAIGIIGLIILIDRYERRPWYLLLGTFLWGALIAIPPAFFIEKFFNVTIQNLAMGPWAGITQSILLGLNAGLTEEAVKGIGLIVLVFLVRNKFSTISDGIIYGAIIGAGFGMIENVAYFAVVQSKKDLLILIIGRIILGWLGHSTFTACFGAALGYIRERQSPVRPWLIPLLGFGAAVLLHSFFDFVAVLASDAGLGAPGSPLVALLAVIIDYAPLFIAQGILYVILMRSLAREAAILREYLVPDVCAGIVLPEEYLLLQEASPRQRLQRDLLFFRDMRLWMAIRNLQHALVGLGFALWYDAMMARGYRPPIALLGPENYRRRIRHLRREIALIEAQELPRQSAPSLESGRSRV